MAADQVQVMKHFGFDSFFLVGHDRGARVSHRLALDHPQVVKKMMLLDICPTLKMYDETDMKFAVGSWHWFFNIIPSPYPENVIMADPKAYWTALSSRVTHNSVVHTEQALTEYQTSFFQREAVHATCEDYRAAATIDLEHDRADFQAGHKLGIPELRVICEDRGGIVRHLERQHQIWG